MQMKIRGPEGDFHGLVQFSIKASLVEVEINWNDGGIFLSHRLEFL
jgi:hypothetical protein